MYRSINPNTKAQAINDFKNGITVLEIAKNRAISAPTVYKWLQAANIDRRAYNKTTAEERKAYTEAVASHKQAVKDRDQQIIRLYYKMDKNGDYAYTIDDMCCLADTSKATINRVVRNFATRTGTPMRSTKGRTVASGDILIGKKTTRAALAAAAKENVCYDGEKPVTREKRFMHIFIHALMHGGKSRKEAK